MLAFLSPSPFGESPTNGLLPPKAIPAVLLLALCGGDSADSPLPKLEAEWENSAGTPCVLDLILLLLLLSAEDADSTGEDPCDAGRDPALVCRGGTSRAEDTDDGDPETVAAAAAAAASCDEERRGVDGDLLLLS